MSNFVKREFRQLALQIYKVQCTCRGVMSAKDGFDPLLNQIEVALDLYGVKATRFGEMVCKDPSLVAKLRGGRRIKKIKLRDAIRQIIHQLESGAI